MLDWLLAVPRRIHLGLIYTTQLLSFYNTSNQLLSLYNSTSWIQRLYLANFLYLNTTLISTWTLTWLDLQSWTLSWLNFFLNSVFKLNRILWSFSWLRSLDLRKLKLLIFILLGLDLNWVIYLRIFLGSNYFRSSPSTWIDPFYLTRIQLYLLVKSVLYKLDVPMYKKVSYPKQRSLLLLHVFVLPDLLTQVLIRSGNSLTNFLLEHFPRFLPEIVPDSFPESLPRTLPESLRESYLDMYPIRLTQPYQSAYLAGQNLTRSYTRPYPSG
jgi:hypothetical protein